MRTKPSPPNKLTKETLLSIHSTDLFCNTQNFFHCLGIMGGLHLLAISAIIFLQIPVFHSWNFCRYVIYVVRSLGTLSMLFCPCFFGGFVQALKTLGAKLGVKRLKSNQNTNKFICDS
ncbi:unnamed protein product [Auanema sp. JU1783]|nr:unnamed protein product [Auanema sp. JU1783]